MNSLNAEPLATLIPRLFSAAEVADAKFRSQMDRTNWSESDYKTMYGRAKEAYLPVGPVTGRLLYMLARTSRARAIVEFGTSFGISTLHLAAALRDNGGGRLVTSELEPSKADKARENLRTAGLADLVDVRVGDALVTLAADLPEQVDLLLLDGAKSLYPKILSLIEPRLREGAIIVADNADMCPPFLQQVRAANGRYLSVPFGDDVEMTMLVPSA